LEASGSLAWVVVITVKQIYSSMFIELRFPAMPASEES